MSEIIVFMRGIIKPILVYQIFRRDSLYIKSKGFLVSCLSTYGLYSPHNQIKEKYTELIEQTLNREGSLYLACNKKESAF